MADMTDYDKSFIDIVKSNYPKNADKIIDAYNFAESAHKGILRKSGEPYIIHPVEVAKILINNNMDYSTIVAGLLHDVVEDTEYSLDDIRDRFGETVSKLVDGVTKIDNFTLQEKNLTEADSIKRLIIAMGDDIRVIFIKLADRLHNMKTIEFLSPKRQIAIATETNELFIPIAERLGIRNLRSELQELTFRCLHPDRYNEIKTEFDRNFEAKKEKIDEIEKHLDRILSSNKIKGKVVSWPERYYSIYKKLQTSGMEKVYGVIMFKIIVPTTIDCYKMLGLLHSEFEHIPGQIKDFIASPKPNGYKSLHTVLINSDGSVTFKVMLRTAEMDNVCEYGLSSLWSEKDADIDFNERFEKYNGFKSIVSNEKSENVSSNVFIDAIKTDLASKEIWVLTPKNKPICLKSDKPTAIDFAYALNENIGKNAIGAVINGKKSSVGTVLKNGDVVKILLSETEKSPGRNWLFIAKTTFARRKIREYFSSHTIPQYIDLGKIILDNELKKINHTEDDFFKYYDEIEKEFDFWSKNDMFASIGYNSLTVNQLLKYLYKEDSQKNILNNFPIETDGNMVFSGINFPKCCSAIPGDEIVGVTSKNGISVHRADCVNLKRFSPSEIIRARWKDTVNQKFNVNLRIIAKDSVGFAAKLLTVISGEGVDVSKLEAKKYGKDECEFRLSVFEKNTSEMQSLIEKIKTIQGVRIVSRFSE